MACTSPTFEGMIASMKPNKSWVARWFRMLIRQRIDKFIPGIYAVQVVGQLPYDIDQELQHRNHLVQ